MNNKKYYDTNNKKYYDTNNTKYYDMNNKKYFKDLSMDILTELELVQIHSHLPQSLSKSYLDFVIGPVLMNSNCLKVNLQTFLTLAGEMVKL
jgi:hypothetical protein